MEPILQADPVTFPESVDWRTTGNVLPPINQGMCEAGYVFSAISLLESAISIQQGVQPQSLSVRYIFDCDYTGLGCRNGGSMFKVWRYIQQKGIPLWNDFYDNAPADPKGTTMIQRACMKPVPSKMLTFPSLKAGIVMKATVEQIKTIL